MKEKTGLLVGIDLSGDSTVSIKQINENFYKYIIWNIARPKYAIFDGLTTLVALRLVVALIADYFLAGKWCEKFLSGFTTSPIAWFKIVCSSGWGGFFEKHRSQNLVFNFRKIYIYLFTMNTSSVRNKFLPFLMFYTCPITLIWGFSLSFQEWFRALWLDTRVSNFWCDVMGRRTEILWRLCTYFTICINILIHFQSDGLIDETERMLDLHPDRIGHGTYIHPKFGGSEVLLAKTESLKIPIGN